MQQNVPNVPILGLRIPSVQQGAPMPMAMPSSSMEHQHQHQHLLLDEDRRQNKRYELISVLYNNLNIKKNRQINKKKCILFCKERKFFYMYSNTMHRKIHFKG